MTPVEGTYTNIVAIGLWAQLLVLFDLKGTDNLLCAVAIFVVVHVSLSQRRQDNNQVKWHNSVCEMSGNNLKIIIYRQIEIK